MRTVCVLCTQVVIVVYVSMDVYARGAFFFLVFSLSLLFFLLLLLTRR